MQYRYFIHLAYNGASYAVWQRQPNAPSIQQCIEEKLALLLRHPISIVGCGRTDTGVHASQYFAHFDSPEVLDSDLRIVQLKLNAMLPPDIAIYSIFPVASDLHARFSATKRTYKYFISTQKNPFFSHSSWAVPYSINPDLMNQACQIILKHSDFTSFAKLHASSNNNICHIKECFILEYPDHLLFQISADRFVRNMVRALTGTIVDVGRMKISLPQLNDIFEIKNRNAASMSAPAKGLFLSQVEYPDNSFPNTNLYSIKSWLEK